MGAQLLDYASDVACYRAEFRRYLTELDWADEWRSASFGTTEEAFAYDATVLRRLHDDGWNRYGWPESAGGLGGNALHRATFYSELARAMLPAPVQLLTLETLGPAMCKYAPTLAATHLPAYFSGAEWWGQSFSEPEAGSDLAALRTRAVDDGPGGFLVNGSKIWTSQGPTATRFLVLARTGTLESRHRGLSMFLIDAAALGVQVRPIALASGRRALAEVFFDDVRVPRERLIGDIDSGWSVAMHLMQFERGMFGYQTVTMLLTQLGRLRRVMTSRRTTTADRQRFAEVYVSVLAAHARSTISIRDLASNTPLGPASSIDKLLFTRAEKDVADLIFDTERTWFLTGEHGGNATELDTARGEWWYSRAATIQGGSAEIQRGIIADHILGLPKEKR